MKRLLPTLLAAAALLPGPVRASKPKVRLERIDPTAAHEDQLRLYASAVELEGNVLDDLQPSQFTLLVDGKASGRATRVTRFEDAPEEIDVVLVIERAATWKKDIEAVKEAAKELLEDPPRKMRAMVISYASETEPGNALEPAAALTDTVDDLSPDDDSVDMRMVEAVDAALVILRRLDPKAPGQVPPRRMIVLISDGLNAKMDRATFRALGDRAARAGIPIHSIAFSPTDDRGPLLNLGELSKRSNGTFRWAQKPSDLKAQFATLADEIKKQYVLTFKAPVKQPEKHLFRLRVDDMISNSLRGDNQSTGPAIVAKKGLWERLGVWRWIGGGTLLAVALGFGVLLVLRARQAAPPKPKVAKPRATKVPSKPVKRPAEAAPGRQTAAAGGGRAAPAAAARPAGPTSLVMIGGALAGQRLPLRGSMSIGKAPGQTLTISDDPTVSGRHCELGLDGQGPFVRDLGSTNGTFVNNQRISGMHRLSDGDIVRLGASTQFKVRID